MPLKSGTTKSPKKEMNCKSCNKTFKITYRNGVRVSTICRSCQMKKERLKKQSVKLKSVPKKKTKSKKPTRTKLKNKLDAVFSLYIRRSSADKMGDIVCVCCNRKYQWKDAQNMHYISRGHMSTRWDELNCFAGCYGCNVAKNGNYPAYTEFLLKVYGVKGLESLIKKKYVIKKFTLDELREKIEYYEKKLRELD
jgi:hypothetical protein